MNMAISYEKLLKIMEKHGESLHSLYKKGVLSDYAKRKITNSEPISLEYIDRACQHFNVPIEDLVEIKLNSED